MSSSTPADSDASGISSSNTDPTSGEEYNTNTSLHGASDSDDKNFSSDPALLLEEHERESSAPESEALEGDLAEARVEEGEKETERPVPANDVPSSEEETTKLDAASEVPSSEEETERPVPANEVQISEEETTKLDDANDVQINEEEEETTKLDTNNEPISADKTEEEAEQLTPAEKSAAKSEEGEKVTVGIGVTDASFRKKPPVYELNIPQKRHFTRYWILSVALLLLLMIAILTPLIMLVSYGVNAYATYNLLRAHAYGGIEHLLTVKTIFTGASSHPTSVLDQSKLTRAQQEIVAAHDDFVQVQRLLDTTSLIQTVTQYLPQYRPQVASVRAASQIGIDATLIGEQIMATTLKLAPKFRSPLLSSTTQTPLVTESDLERIGSTITAVMPYLNDIQAQTHTLSLGNLPISSSQRTQLQEVLQFLPQVQTLLQRGQELLEPANWLLGVDQPRVFLVQTMDRAELRPTGGFTGQYGELSIQSGRVGPFSLHDISNVEYTDNSPTIGQPAPAAYRSWWPFANWGLRDSNLSADFPTSARIAITEYKHEVNRNVDGVISFTPFFIEHLLQAIGPIQIPKYHETITAENLEQKLHYYQLDNAGIRKIEIVEHVTANDPNIRKLFTSAVASVLMSRIRHATPTELLSLGLQVLQDLKTKDLQVYMTNPQIESLLEQYNDAAEIDRSNTHDGLSIVQTNVSASKASQYVQTILHDTVKLDAQGGATHTLQMHLIYDQIGPVYGLDTYRDYIRFYVPKSAQLLSGNGFDTGVALCGGTQLAACPANGVYPQMTCPTGQYAAGASAQMIGDPYKGEWHPIDQIGPPDNTTSDLAGKGMFGGYVVIPKNCSMMITLSWYVPPLTHGSYDLLVQRQASTFPSLDLTVIPPAGTCTSNKTGLHDNGILILDTSFQLKGTSISQPNSGTCSLVESTNTPIQG